MNHPQRARLALAASAVAAVIAAPSLALACGGLFCSRPTPMSPSPEPVDQTAERIVFEVHPDDTVTAHVQIQYTGSADAFAWVVPVSGEPLFVAESSAGLFSTLESSTGLRVNLPAPIGCQQNNGPVFFGGGGGDGGGFACGPSADDSGSSAEPQSTNTNGPAPLPNPDDPVTVFASDFTENFEFAVIGARESGELITWLNDNGYNVSDNMTPVMDVYNDPGMRFLALKLRDGKLARDIVPIAFRFPAKAPMIPIQLTAVAAQPHMGIQVFIIADEPWVPRNFDSVTPLPSTLLYRDDGTVNYYDWVAREVAEADGHRFITEYVGANPVQNMNFADQTIEGSIVSRYYTRLSPEQMDRDPAFRIASSSSWRVSNTIDMSQNMSIHTCDSNNTTLLPISGREPNVCAFNYCGPGATCYSQGGQAGCLCADGQTAQQVSGPDGVSKVVCTPNVNPYGVTQEAAGVGTMFDPCSVADCGEGVCLVKAGFPTCVCDSDAVAMLGPEGAGVICTSLRFDAREFGPGAGPEAGGVPVALPDNSTSTGFTFLFWLPAALGLGVFLGRSRRRRRDRH